MKSTPDILASDRIPERANDIVDEFLHRVSEYQARLLNIDCISFDGVHLSEKAPGKGKTISVESDNGILKLTIDTEELHNIPGSVFQGWLELEIAHFLEKRGANSNCFNFQKQILPLMPVSGSSLYFLRELVEFLRQSLARHRTTKLLVQMGRGEPQVDFYFYTLNTSAADRELTKKFKDHSWTRASHLCKKLIQYTGLSWLADHRVAYSPALKTEWLRQNGYGGNDQFFLDEMVAIANCREEREFTVRLAEMFVVLRDRLLLNSGQNTVAYDSSPVH